MMFMYTIFVAIIISCIISSIAILTDNTPDSAYDLLAGKKQVMEDWIHE